NCSDSQFPSVKSRSRSCRIHRNCSGETFQERPCNLPQCTNETECSGENCTWNCSWNVWSEWSECSRWCGVGQQHRLRTYNTPQPGGQWCEGILTGNLHIRFCNIKACKVNGGWSSWSPWSKCDRSCGGGKSLRIRSCTDPPPKNGGKRCTGERFKAMLCNVQPCGADGCPVGQEYVGCANKCPRACIDFQSGIVCSDSGLCEAGCRCPDGYLEQDGACVAPWQCQCTDTLGQSWAPGSRRQVECSNCTCAEGRITCSNSTCPISDCAWSQWSTWSPCSISCGTGTRSRFSTCGNGRLTCTFAACVRNGHFTAWSPWTSCSRSCGGIGHMTRSRDCSNPAPANGGRDCAGPRVDVKFCQTAECQVPAPTREPVTSLPDSDGFSPWTAWTRCSRNCSDSQFPSVKSRSRSCRIHRNCSGETFQERPCNLPQCTNETECSGENCTWNCSWNVWSEWSECSRWCGVGQQHRLRTYNTPQPGGQWCEGILTGNLHIRFCNIKACKVNGGWSSWSPWSKCDRSCGGGKSLRIRSCTDPPPKNGGKRCTGERFKAMLCNVQPCGADGCPVGQEYVDCANKCPRACIDFQSGIVCSDSGLCEAGCRCPD
uniref:SCO-spondin-like n=1 Tax=Pristiophorus japonicus TaxID=55135 RepID=UPI00398F766B